MAESTKRIKVSLTPDQKYRVCLLSKRLGLKGKMAPCLLYCLSEWDRRLYSGDRSEESTTKKSSQIQVDVTETEYRRLKATASGFGLSLAALFRLAFLRLEATKFGRKKAYQSRSENTSARP